jgi:hypothetical protein
MPLQNRRKTRPILRVANRCVAVIGAAAKVRR